MTTDLITRLRYAAESVNALAGYGANVSTIPADMLNGAADALEAAHRERDEARAERDSANFGKEAYRHENEALRMTNAYRAVERAEAAESSLARAVEGLREVERWWLEEEMQHHNGAPYALFQVRALLAELAPKEPR